MHELRPTPRKQVGNFFPQKRKFINLTILMILIRNRNLILASINNDEQTYFRPACKNISSRLLARLLLKVVCNKNVDGNKTHLVCVVCNNIVIDIDSQLKTKTTYKI